VGRTAPDAEGPADAGADGAADPSAADGFAGFVAEGPAAPQAVTAPASARVARLRPKVRIGSW
jgi:hypothetical protein